MKAVFEQVKPAEFRKRLENAGAPSALAQGLTQLAEVVAGQEDYVEADGVIKGREVRRVSSDAEYPCLCIATDLEVELQVEDLGTVCEGRRLVWLPLV